MPVDYIFISTNTTWSHTSGLIQGTQQSPSVDSQDGPQSGATTFTPNFEQQKNPGPRIYEAERDTLPLLKRLRRKADWHIVPLTFLCYLMNLIVKVAYNVSEYITKP